MTRGSRTAIAVIVLLAIQLAGCGGPAMPQRPPFCNYYGPHSDGRSPFSQWWLLAPRRDYAGISFRGDHKLNLLLLYVGSDFDIWLNYADGRVFDEHGYVLLWDQGGPGRPADQISVANTPDILTTKNRLFAFNRAGEWHDFVIPEGFAKEFEDDFLSPCANPPKEVLVELERFAKQRGLDDLSDWVATQK